MKHAYLIIAHNKWDQLRVLLSMLDSEQNDIYLHIDKKAKNVPIQEIKDTVKFSQIQIFREYKVYWGSFEIVQVELLLFREAIKNQYDYYHLLSGMDLPIKSLEEIDSFFCVNNGKEFVHFDTDERLLQDREIGRRTRLFHFLQNYRRRYRWKSVNAIFTFLERISLVMQIVLRIDRLKNYPSISIRYGSQWVSITHDFAKYVVQNEKLIYQLFKYTNCADELFIQTLAYNSEFKEQLYRKQFDDDVRANMRLIDLKVRGNNGNPYTWKYADLKEITNSECLWARKFDADKDNDIILAICNTYGNKEV